MALLVNVMWDVDENEERCEVCGCRCLFGMVGK